jgi:hypothetical protein
MLFAEPQPCWGARPYFDMQKRRIAHAASLVIFLIFCKIFSRNLCANAEPLPILLRPLFR